jgi:hypothetical protein
MRDLFAPKVNEHAFIKPVEGSFRYICGVFSGDGPFTSSGRVCRRKRFCGPSATYLNREDVDDQAGRYQHP